MSNPIQRALATADRVAAANQALVDGDIDKLNQSNQDDRADFTQPTTDNQEA